MAEKRIEGFSWLGAVGGASARGHVSLLQMLLGGSLSHLGEGSEFLGFAPTSLDMPRSGVFTEMLEIALNRTGGSFLDHVVSMS